MTELLVGLVIMASIVSIWTFVIWGLTDGPKWATRTAIGVVAVITLSWLAFMAYTFGFFALRLWRQS